MFYKMIVNYYEFEYEINKIVDDFNITLKPLQNILKMK